MKKNKKEKRKFNGPLKPRDEKPHGDFGEMTIKEYCNMQKKHLHAYLMGDTRYKYKGKWYLVDMERYGG